MFYQYGLYKPLVNSKLGSPSTIRQFFPLLFVLGIVIGFPLSFINRIFAELYVCVLALYVIMSIIYTYKSVARTRNYMLFLYQPITYFTIHFGYGWGYLVGIYKLLFKIPFSAESNR